jgi:flagellar biosynthesis/type III secretory pathway protein FliH
MINAEADKAEALMRLEYEAAERWSKLENSIVDLAVNIVRRIALRLGSENFMPALVETALAEVKKSSHVVLRVSPLSVSNVTKYLNDLGLTTSHLRSLEVRSDTTIGDFECVLETELGFVVADLDIQLKSISNFFNTLRIKCS